MTKEDLAFIRALRDKGVEVTFSQPNKTVDSFYENPAAMGSNASYPYRTLQNPSYGDIRIDPPQYDDGIIHPIRLEKRYGPSNVTPEMMQEGAVEGNYAPIIYKWEDLDKFNTAQEAFLDSIAAKDFSDFLANPNSDYPLGYENIGKDNITPFTAILPKDKEKLSRLGKRFINNYASLSNADEEISTERLNRVDPTGAVFADYGYKRYPVWDSPKTKPFIEARPRMEVEKRPVTSIKMPGGTMSKEDFIKRYGQKVWDEQNRTPELQEGSVEPLKIKDLEEFQRRQQSYNDSLEVYNLFREQFNVLNPDLLYYPSGASPSNYEDALRAASTEAEIKNDGAVNRLLENRQFASRYFTEQYPNINPIRYAPIIDPDSGSSNSLFPFYKKPTQPVEYKGLPKENYQAMPARLTTQALSDQLMSQTINNDLTAPIPQESIIKDLPVLTPKASPIKEEVSFTAKGYPMIDAKNRTTTTVPEGEVWNEKRGWHRKMQEGGMERQKFSKEDLSFMRALRDRGVEVTFSSEGYRDDSPDRNNSVNVIDTKGTGRISMNNNDGTPIQNTPRILAITDRGQSKILESGNEYKLDGNKVLEIPMMQVGGPESPNYDAGMGYIPAPYSDAYTQSNAVVSPELGDGSAAAGDMGVGFNMNTLMAVGSGISQISNSLAALGPESSTEVGSVSGMGGSREQAVEGTIAGTLSSIPIVGQFYQIGSGIGKGFEAGANALYAEGNTAGGEAMTAIQGAIDPSSQWGRNAELWEAGYLSDGEAALNFVGGFFGFGGGPMMDRRVREIADRKYKGAMTRATGGMHIAGTPSAESAGKFSRATGYPKPKRT